MSGEITSPFTVFFDRSGQPLDNGYVYIGTAGINPEVSPITVYWDSSLTTTAAQPIRTLAGYPSRDGSPGTLIINQATYSIVVRDRNGTLVFSSLNETSDANVVRYFGGNASSIQAAITAAAALEETVLLPSGDYTLTAGLTHSTGAVKLMGQDAGTQGTRFQSSLNAATFTPTAQCTIEGIGFLGSNEGAKTAQVGIALDDVNNIHIRNCVFDELYTSITLTDTVFYTQIKNNKFFSSTGPMIVGGGAGAPGYAIQFHGNEIIPTAVGGSVLDLSNLGSINSMGNVISPANATEYCLRVRTMATAAGVQQFSNDVFEGSDLSAINLEGASSAAPCRYFFFSNCYANQANAGEPTLLLKHVRTLHWVGGYISGEGAGIRFNAGNASDIHIGPVRFELNSATAAITALAGSDIRGLHLKGVTLNGGIQKLLDLSAMAAADLDNINIDASTEFGTTASPVVMPAGAYAKLNWRHENKFSAHKGGTDQTGIVSLTATKLTWSTELYDVRDRFASSTWSPYTGVQRMVCHIYATNVTAGGTCELKLYKNGVEFLRGPSVNGSASNDVMMEASWEFLSEPGDTFDVYIRALSPGTVTVSGGASLSYLTGSQV